MKKKLLFLFLINVYVIQFLLLYILSPLLRFFGLNYTPVAASKYFLFALFSLSFVLIIINIITAFLGLRRSDSSIKKIPLGVILGIKLALIPFYICHAFWFLLMMGGTANPFLFVLWFIIPLLFFIYAYLVLLTTSSYQIVRIIKMGKSSALTKGQCICHIVMQLLFFTDVIDSVYLFFKYRKTANY